jgi:hypothetical protein
MVLSEHTSVLGRNMGIYLHLQTHGMTTKEITCITKAYEQTLRTLCVKDRDDPLTELVTQTIIKIAQTGVKDPAQISARAIRELEMLGGRRAN